MSREGKSLIWSAVAGLLIGLAICVAFGVLDVQCYGTERQNWNPTTQACD